VSLLYEKKEKIAVITLNRPEVLNTINPDMADKLFKAWLDFSNDPELLVLIVSGAGDKAYCVGADIKDRDQTGQDPHVSEFWGAGLKTPMRGMEVNKPVIAAINGYCLGGGLELALVCDLRIASENARFGQPEIKRGIFPGMGATQRLPRSMPYNLAAELLLTGEQIDAREAYRIGLINRVLPLEQLMKAAWALAETISENAPLALRAAKEALLRSYDLPLEQGLRLEGLLRKIIGETEDAGEGRRAFIERRKPEFKNR
jgi:enoyl-CoA hydratase/carnithine racemase